MDVVPPAQTLVRVTTKPTRRNAPVHSASPSPSPGYRRTVIRWLCAFLVGAVLSGFAFLFVTGQYIKKGPVVTTLTENHGVHAGDVLVIAGWAVSMLALLGLAAAPGRRARS
jgi:hypothetical protein